MIWIFAGCNVPCDVKTVGANTARISLGDSKYIETYDGCKFITIYNPNGITSSHLPTCTNPYHRIDTVIIKEVIEFK